MTASSTAYRQNRGANECSADGCDRPFRCSGYCAVHYERSRRGVVTLKDGRKRPTTATEAWCFECEQLRPWEVFRSGRAVCNPCYRVKYQKRPCPGCGNLLDSRAKLCQPCFALSRRGKPTKTGRYVTQQGYAMLTGKYDHPNARANGHMAEHALVMSEMLGRPLVKGENVHHVNGVRDDNRPENLELWVVSQPPGQRAVDLTAWAKEILARYAPEALHDRPQPSVAEH